MKQLIGADRIDGIDALRAFALLGILLVHTTEGFGFYEQPTGDSAPDSILIVLVNNIFRARSNAIFSLLFGCSFWFLLRKTGYSSLKFVWRCLVLIGFGVVAKLFYTYDILMWYGLNGIVMVLFRRCSERTILLLSVSFILGSACLSTLHLGDLFAFYQCEDRYVAGCSMKDIVTYPLMSSIMTNLGGILSSLSLRTLGLMMLGYWLGRKGYIMRWRELASPRLIVISGAFTVAFFILYHLFRSEEESLPFNLSADLMCVSQALCMSLIVIYLCRKERRWISPMACYGRLGLTNYFFQGVVGVTLFCTWFIPCGLPLSSSAAVMLGFYLLQLAFSVIWCRSHRYGPLEYLWRKATNLISG